MMTFLKRLLLVPIGFVGGVAVAVVVLITLGSEQVTHALAGRTDLSISDSVGLIRQTLMLASAITLVPAVLIVIVGEVARIRTVYYYVLGGGAALCAIPAMAWLGEAGMGASPPAIMWQVFATAGFMGGFAYWMIAGRGA
jgi:hypothetical protein